MAIELGGPDIEPFVNLIEGGRDGQIFQDMKDFFYYSMIKAKKENTTKTRKLDGTVPLEQLPNLMRAMGYYPTKKEVNNMIEEVKYSVYADDGNPVSTVDMPTFIRLFVNHRPVYGIGKNDIEDAFKALLSGETGGLQLNREELIRMLKEEGEKFTTEELQESFGYLVGKTVEKEALPKDFINAEEFASDLLGFEEYEEGDEEADIADGAMQGTGSEQAMNLGMGPIAEEPGY